MRTDYDAIMDDFGSRAGIDNMATAERAAIETLLTLGESIPTAEADALGVRLPGALGDAITEHRDTHEERTADEFVVLVADREGIGVSPEDAVIHTRATIATIAAHGGDDELRRVHDHLPESFDPLFETAELAG
ncbi:DUF2267 domain-containing protein [Halorientalis regularis]|jgi:uncharacterized protein (DUF2267 family)|uniref:Uncharacterized conserved protein, DUF2267 family n=1 Tax=Halorientalis regularis TaxID=660518 RepID=A0A1G7JAL2_9EURY|nr:DUF2267 domain-containing protein [Halorientalis regularis]SDF21918.1 Uncharacterized conserved protein, DUF2267 family [Halorientalis regularis]